jgi:hypothetical protein
MDRFVFEPVGQCGEVLLGHGTKSRQANPCGALPISAITQPVSSTSAKSTLMTNHVNSSSDCDFGRFQLSSDIPQTSLIGRLRRHSSVNKGEEAESVLSGASEAGRPASSHRDRTLPYPNESVIQGWGAIEGFKE